MLIRKLTRADMPEAIGLMVLCWQEETEGILNNELVASDELALCNDWMDKANENDGVRLSLGAFENEKMLGVACGSFVEPKSNSQDVIELNGLWIYPKYRKRGISFALLKELLTEFFDMGASKMIVNNYPYVSSNAFFRYLGCKVTGTKTRINDNMQTDVFTGNIALMLDIIRKSELEFRLLDKSDISRLEEIMLDDAGVFNARQIEKYISIEGNFAFGAVKNNKVIGLIYGHTLCQFTCEQPQFFVYSVFIHSAYRSKGYGSRFFQYVVDYCFSNSYDEVFVPTDKGNISACRVYKKAGGKSDIDNEIIYVIKNVKNK